MNGLIFGLFRVALFGILPTAFLGMIFAAVTLITGSIFPAMVWHGLNNVAMVLLARSGVDVSGIGPVLHLAGAAALVTVFRQGAHLPRSGDCRSFGEIGPDRD